MELDNLLVTDKITALCQTKMAPNYHIKRCKEQKWTLKNCEANEFSKSAIAMRLNLQDCPSVIAFVFAVL